MEATPANAWNRFSLTWIRCPLRLIPVVNSTSRHLPEKNAVVLRALVQDGKICIARSARLL